MMNIDNETICAIATGQGGAIGIIRVSGIKAIEITDSIFTPASGNSLCEKDAYTLTFGYIKDNENNIVDEVLISLFRSPHSYTGENSTEIMCHASSYILQKIIQLLISHGCRTAHPGEYTQRAFLNGKMDLSQAEAVADLITSSNEATHRLAMNQMRGGFSKELNTLRKQLLDFTSLIELELDFSEEDVQFADRTHLCTLASHIEKVIAHLVQSFDMGNAIKNGIPVAIIGETNAGKSTLLNFLVNEERAIVSDIHGTTRDVIEDTINIQGVTFRFIDTAGIRETADTIENLGIERTFKKLNQATIVLWVIDSTTSNKQYCLLSEKILPHCKNKRLIRIFNKCDLLSKEQLEHLTFINKDTESVFVSIKNKINTDAIQNLLAKYAMQPNISQNDVIVTNIRHYESLTYALNAIHRVQEGLTTQLSGDLLSQDIRECIFYLGNIVGEVSNNEILENIFSKFCIGK